MFENLGYTTKTFNDKDGKLSEIEVEYTQGGWTLRTFIQWNADQTVYSFRNLIAKSESKKPLSPELIKEMLKQTGSVFPATLYFTEFEGTQVVILYLDLKKSVWSDLDGVVKKSAIFATNTSGFAISDLNKAVARRDRFIGFHWFSPAYIMKPVEIIYAPETSEETIATMEAIGAKLEKVTIRVKDAPGKYGFVANRIYFAMVAEARRVLEEGVATGEDIDTVMKLGFNWPVGPLGMTKGARGGWQ